MGTPTTPEPEDLEILSVVFPPGATETDVDEALFAAGWRELADEATPPAGDQ